MLKKILEQWKNREWTEEDAYKLPEGFEFELV